MTGHARLASTKDMMFVDVFFIYTFTYDDVGDDDEILFLVAP